MTFTFNATNKGWIFHSFSNINIFNKADFNKAFDLFWLYAKQYFKNKKFGLILKIKDNNGNIRSLGPLFKFTKQDRELLRKVLLDYINLKGNSYSEIIVSEIIFQYIILGDGAVTDIPNITPNQVESFPFGDYNLPLTTDLDKWGKINKTNKFVTIKSENYSSDIKVYVFPDKQVYHFTIDGKVILKVIDYFGKNPNDFTRVIKKQKFYINNGEIVFKTLTKDCGFINKIKEDKELINNFLTLDIETRVINNVHTPFCISFYDGTKAWSFYLSEYSSSNDMLINALSSIHRWAAEKKI